MSKPQRKFKVIIIGGGVAGLGLCQKLSESGLYDFLLVEAQNKLGGRILSVPHGDHLLEYGAQWIHGEEGNAVYQFAKENFLIDEEKSWKQTGLNIDEIGIGETMFVRENGSQISEVETKEFLMLMANLSEKAEESVFSTYKGSVGSYYEETFKKVNRWGQMGIEMLNWYGRFQSCVDGTNSWFDLSGIGTASYKECPGNQVVNWSEGYEKLIRKLEESIPTSNVQLNSPVRKIYWKTSLNSQAEVELHSGERIKADHIVITMSLGVLKAMHEEMFEPKLPQGKIHAIQCLDYGAVNKIYLEFPNKWWEDGCDGFSFLRNEAIYAFNQQNWEKGIMGFYEVYKSPKVLCGWLTGEAAKAMEQCSVECVKQKCVNLLRFYLGSKYKIPEAVWCDRTNWYTNPYTRGSYSYHSCLSDATNVSSKDLASPLLDDTACPVLCFAGEATHDCYFSTVHGALESGWREAKRIIEYQSSLFHNETSIVPKKYSFEVVIIGAGAAGLTAARELEANGLTSLLILEGLDRIGGRINTFFFSPGKYLEFGAQWIHGQHQNVLYDIAAPRGLISQDSSVDGEGDFYTEEGIKISPDIVLAVMDFYEKIKDEGRLFMSLSLKKYPPSVGHYFRARFDEYLNDCEADSPYVRHLKSSLCQWIVRWERVDNACDSLHQLSTLHWGHYSYCGGFDNLNPKNGMTSVIKSIAGDATAEIRLNTQVVSIDYSSNLVKAGKKFQRQNGKQPVIITCNDGSIVECQHVIATPSLGYLKKHPDLFQPALPPILTEAIHHLGFGLINKIFLEYEEPWWNKDCTGIHLVWSENVPDFDRTTPGQSQNMSEYWYKAIVGFDPPYGNKSALCGWIGGPEAEFMESLSEEDVGVTCTLLLRKFTNNQNIPKPKKVYRSRWASEPLTLGSYSHRLTEAKQLNEGKCYSVDLNHPVKAQCSDLEVPVLVLAGEANSLNYYSTMHGAIESGQQQAAHYINFKDRQLSNMKLRNKL